MNALMSVNHVKKIRMLSLVSLAQHASVRDSPGAFDVQTIPYARLMQSLQLTQVSELYDFLMECLYAGIIQGKLNHQKQCLLVTRVMGRDVNADKGRELLISIKQLEARCEKSVLTLDAQLHHVEKELERASVAKKEYEGALEAAQTRSRRSRLRGASLEDQEERMYRFDLRGGRS